MNADRLNCKCGHRLAVHTYFKNLTPCTVCRCDTFANEPLIAEAAFKPKPARRSTRYATTDSRAEAERRP